MRQGLFNIVLDGQFGSTGKGAIATYLANKYKPEIITTTNMANAGHTAVNENGDKFIAKALPTSAILKKWSGGEYNPWLVVGSSAAFTLDQMYKEVIECEVDKCVIHQRAGVITQEHKEQEALGTKYLASTMQGCGTFLANKVARKQDLKLARDYSELAAYTDYTRFNLDNELEADTPMHMALNEVIGKKTILHEGSQGYSLDIHHGHSYPFCTSRQTISTQAMADIGIPFYSVGDIYLVIRPYPIRVGNVVEGDTTVGYSGDWYSDQHEIEWSDVAKAAGVPADLSITEKTTVTGRIRRVATFSKQQLVEAVTVNGATRIALNFANYIDWKCYGTNDYGQLSDKILNFIDMIEQLVSIPVTLIGTGPQLNHVVEV
jgi:adenylosuccinate synthase